MNMKHVGMIVAGLGLVTVPVISHADESGAGDRIEHRLDVKGDRINDRLDRKGERIDRRLNRKGETIDRRFDRRSDRAERHFDRSGERFERHMDRRGARRGGEGGIHTRHRAHHRMARAEHCGMRHARRHAHR